MKQKRLVGFRLKETDISIEEYYVHNLGGTVLYTKNKNGDDSLFHGLEFGRMIDNSEEISQERLLGAIYFALQSGIIKSMELDFE
ncbi:hypothetical protein [Bacillus cereus group sp. BfR-BA-01328]|uniref:hypothetical protein n=1 Tax=Bacillus cereus group sp. BfR-BA-01328 TaxID=2920304 RepID=UPI001F5A7542